MVLDPARSLGLRLADLPTELSIPGATSSVLVRADQPSERSATWPATAEQRDTPQHAATYRPADPRCSGVTGRASAVGSHLMII